MENSESRRFERLISSMNIPAERKTFSVSNVRWFLRNGAIINRGHQNFNDALALAKKLA